MPDVVVAEFMDETAVADLSGDHDVLYDPTLGDRRGALLECLAGARALIVRNRTHVDREVLDAATGLRVVGRLGVGLDNIDLDACEARGVEVRPATGANAVAVAEYVMAAILVLVRRVFDASAEVAAGAWPRERLVGGEVSGRQLGLIGFGAVARQVAVRAAALGMGVVAFDPYLTDDDDAWSLAERVDIDALLTGSEAVSVHVPLAPETHHLLDAAAIARMPPGAVLVNTARGGVVDEEAVADALRAGRLGGAALDVFETEPLGGEAGARLSGVPNLLLTPHIAGVTQESNRAVGMITAANVREVLSR